MPLMTGTKEGQESPILYLRDVPADLKRKLRAAAALSGYRSLPTYLIHILKAHVTDLEKKRILPKGRSQLK